MVREDNHEILYLNRRIKELAPHMREGMTCDRMWANSCLNCPLLNIGDRQESQSINNDNLLGTVDMEARRMLWEDEIPAFMITLTPHLDEFSNIYRKILRVNLSRDSYEVVKSGAEEWAIDSRKESFAAWLTANICRNIQKFPGTNFMDCAIVLCMIMRAQTLI